MGIKINESEYDFSVKKRFKIEKSLSKSTQIAFFQLSCKKIFIFGISVGFCAKLLRSINSLGK